jgi:hypothetical protein
MLLDQAENFISDYASSEHFMFLPPAVKENAESLLGAFFRQAGEKTQALESLKARDVEEVFLGHMPRLNVTVEAKRAVPELLDGFFTFLKDTGRFPAAGAWQMCVETVRGKYLEGIRDDGSVKGTTFKKKYTDVGRNDPCPCGSGKKFKKCCMELLG